MDAPRRRPTRSPHLARRLLAAILAAAALAAFLDGCGGAAPDPRRASAATVLAAGRQARVPDPAAALRLARRFARVYAGGAYRRRPPEVTAESATVRAALLAGAARVPPARRGLRPRLLGLGLSLRPGGALAATARVGDGRFPPFSVGFTVSRRAGRWLVSSVSLPD